MYQDQKTHTEACYPCKITKTNHFSPIFSDLNTQNWFFYITGISIRFPYIPDAVLRCFFFFAKVLTNIFIFHILRSLLS